jgi:hypothetical protein
LPIPASPITSTSRTRPVSANCSRDSSPSRPTKAPRAGHTPTPPVRMSAVNTNPHHPRPAVPAGRTATTSPRHCPDARRARLAIGKGVDWCTEIPARPPGQNTDKPPTGWCSDPSRPF